MEWRGHSAQAGATAQALGSSGPARDRDTGGDAVRVAAMVVAAAAGALRSTDDGDTARKKAGTSGVVRVTDGEAARARGLLQRRAAERRTRLDKLSASRAAAALRDSGSATADAVAVDQRGPVGHGSAAMVRAAGSEPARARAKREGTALHGSVREQREKRKGEGAPVPACRKEANGRGSTTSRLKPREGSSSSLISAQ
ncbi:uncharacterized protein [Miscanthus floridulus]|uniref:uncharacterized protein n=1 Tax=Miscanthus floridulus TaxID=154761 RepID=UPI0034596CCE